mmetsp:Transcript_86190/g.167037  ORF Transcript_86190/g.167037 Transcript_86190/m.167037 type:complete len:362 (+) Transcript_86190:66-1151(+)
MEEEEGFNEELRALKLNDEKLSSWRTKPPSPPHQQCALGGASSSTSAANAAVTSAGEATLTGSSVEQRLLQLEQREVANSRRIEALEASAHVQRKVVCELLLQDLAHDDRAVAAITRVKQLLQRTFPERCDSGIVWLGNGGCQLACLAPETLIHVMEFLKSKFGRTAVSKVAPVFWMPQPNLRRAKSVSSFVHGHGQAVVTLSGHKGLYAKFMGMYELDLRHLVHGYPLFKKMGMPNNPHFIYKCSLNGKWLLTDDSDHFAMNLSRIGTEASCEHFFSDAGDSDENENGNGGGTGLLKTVATPDAASSCPPVSSKALVPKQKIHFEVWRNGAWHKDPLLKATRGHSGSGGGVGPDKDIYVR